MNSPTENKEFLFGDILPQKYKMEAEDVLPYYVYKQILAACPKTGTLQRHYRLNNDFVRKYISGEGEGAAQESAWCSPSALREEGTLLIGSMSLPECESAGTVSVVLLDSTEKQSYYISDAELMYAMSLIGDDLMKDCAVIVSFTQKITIFWIKSERQRDLQSFAIAMRPFPSVRSVRLGTRRLRSRDMQKNFSGISPCSSPLSGHWQSMFIPQKV